MNFQDNLFDNTQLISPSHDNREDVLFHLKDLGIKTTFVTAAVVGILSECIDQLLILRTKNGCNYSSEFTTDLVEYKSLEERFMGVEDHGACRINQTSSNYDKLANDINMIINIVTEARRDVQIKGHMNIIEKCRDAIKKMREDDLQLLVDMEKNEKRIEELRKIYEQERLDNIRTIEETDEKIQVLRFTVEDVLVYGRQETKFFEKWEYARREQNTLSCEYKENKNKDIINDYNKKIDQENRCHEEVMRYLEESTNDYKEEINYWMKTYDEEIEKREMQIINLRSDLEKMDNDLAEVEKTYTKRQIEVQRWLEYKEQKRLQEEQLAKEIQAATKIQAWWRGTMYRNKLGPYRKKKKGKGDKKGKGKGKKKK